MRTVTSEGLYGADIPFSNGLNVLWADNTKGKSTCMQGMLYALGLEKMLSPRREVPLPHAMTSYLLTDDKKRVDVLESSISLEIENGDGQVITVNRAVKATTDPRLITVDFGPALTQSTSDFARRNFFVLDAGAAQREDGFHFFLEQFLNWQLPMVRRYEAAETKLYLETVFPLFWVEQKFGWSAIPAAIPTYMRIREVHKRAVEFILDLDVYRIELQRERLEAKLATNKTDWIATREELARFTNEDGGRLAIVSDKPIADSETLARGYIEVAVGTDWIPLDTLTSQYRSMAADLRETPVPAVNEVADENLEKLNEVSAQVDQLNAQKIAIHGKQQLKAVDIRSLESRINALDEDLKKNLDVQKLQNYSGTIETLTPDHCPTCEQILSDALLSQESLSAVMPIADNIEYIRSQKKMFENILLREVAQEKDRSDSLGAVNRKIADYYAEIRSLRAEAISPGSIPSAVAIEERIQAEAKVRDLEGLQKLFKSGIERLSVLQREYVKLLSDQNNLPKEKLSRPDRNKLDALTKLLREQTADFGFTTFSPSELSLSEDSYRPEKEGYEIGFETSASDAIRLKWAYQLSLLELASTHQINHPKLLIFDEPRQQSSSKVSFEGLLKRASDAKKHDQQVIFSTSEDLEMLQKITQSLDCEEVIFAGYVLQPIR